MTVTFPPSWSFELNNLANLSIVLLPLRQHWKLHHPKLHCCASCTALECQRNLSIFLSLIEVRQGGL